MIKTRRYKRLVFGFVFSTWNWYDFWNGTMLSPLAWICQWTGCQSFLCVVVFWFVLVVLVCLFCCLLLLVLVDDDGFLDCVQVLHQFTFVALNSRWPQVLIWNYCFCNAIERVKRPGGSHEGVGRKKETDMIFGEGVGLPCSRPLLPTRCWFVWRWCVSTLEQRSWRRCMGGLKTGPSRRHRIQPAESPFFGLPCKGNVFQKGVRKWPAWNQKWSPLEGQVMVPFWLLQCGKSVEAFISSRSWFDQQQLRLESWTGETHFCAPAFSYVLRSKKGPLLCHIVLLQFP